MAEEVTVLCGGASPDGRVGRTLVLNTDAAKDHPSKVNLNITDLTKAMLANVPDRLGDLLEIAAYVYIADQYVSRGGQKMSDMGRDWRRSFHFVIPVRDVAFWKRADIERQLSNCLGFLSDDAYAFSFHTGTGRSLEPFLDLANASGPPAGFSPNRIVLFSGGLDSLTGAAIALRRGDRVALVSHQASPMLQSRQTDLAAALRAAFPGSVFQVGVHVTRGRAEARDYSQRSRSFLFASLALVVARLFGRTDIELCENGVVSVNLPVARHVLGARATRTTHPRTLTDFSSLFSLVAGVPIKVLNPLFWSTKTEVLGKLSDAGFAKLVGRSFSCTRVVEATMSGKGCGVCSQCLDRRFAVLAAGLEESEPADAYTVELLHGEREPGIDTTMALSYARSAFGFATMTRAAFFGRYGEIFRAVGYLDDGPDTAAERLYELHRRHGQAVTGAINKALKGHSSLEDTLRLPATALLSLLRSPFGPLVPTEDWSEDEGSLSDEKEKGSETKPIPRPITLARRHSKNEAIIAGEIVVRGKSYKLIDALWGDRIKSLHAEPEKEAGFLRTDKLAHALEMRDPASVRRRVLRFREEVEKQALEVFGSPLLDDDVIETGDIGGYRLNPHLAIIDDDSIDKERHKQGDVTAKSGMSRAG